MHCVTCREAAEVDKSINNNLNNLMNIKRLAALCHSSDDYVENELNDCLETNFQMD